MEKQFVTYEIAIALKELGFAKPCVGFYTGIHGDTPKLQVESFIYDEVMNAGHQSRVYQTNTVRCLAPLWQQVIDWMLTEHDIYAYVAGNYTGDEGYCAVMVRKGDRALRYVKSMVSTKFYATPNQAREAVILKFIELIKKSKS